MTAEKRLLYVINHMGWFWSHRLKLAQDARDAGWTVHIAAPGATRDTALTAHGFTGHNLPPGTGLSAILTIPRLFFLILTIRPDLVHAVTLKYVFLTGIALQAAKLHPAIKKIRAIFTIAGLGYFFSTESRKAAILRMTMRPFLRLIMTAGDTAIIVQNPDDRDTLLKQRLVRAEKCFLIRGSGVDLDQFPARPLPHRSPPVILMPTRLLHDKGVAVFIKTAELLAAEGIKADFRIAGGLQRGNPDAITELQMNAMLKGNAVSWLGHVDDMPGALAECDLVFYPSHYREGVPKCLLEALATGRPIITTDHAGCREVVSHGINGYLIPVKDPQAAALAIKNFLQLSPEKRQEMSQAARRIAEQDFDVLLVNRLTLEIYKD